MEAPCYPAGHPATLVQHVLVSELLQTLLPISQVWTMVHGPLSMVLSWIILVLHLKRPVGRGTVGRAAAAAPTVMQVGGTHYAERAMG